MAEGYLQVEAGSFAFVVRAGWFYSEDDVWVAWDAGRNMARLGLTDYRQQASQTIIFVELPERGMAIAAGDELANVESVKIDLSVPVPFGGTVLALNGALRERPELINLDPYGEGWLLEMRPDRWPAAELLDAQAYLALIQQRAAEAGR